MFLGSKAQTECDSDINICDLTVETMWDPHQLTKPIGKHSLLRGLLPFYILKIVKKSSKGATKFLKIY
jgi:hypothetical protein